MSPMPFQSYLKELWHYRYLVWKLAATDFNLRYKKSLLGLFWALLEPLLMLLVLYTVFSNLMRLQVQHYQLFLLMGIIGWNFFARSTSMSLSSIIGKPSLVKKIYFPRELLVMSSCVTALMMSLVEFLVFGVFMVFFQIWPGSAILLAIPALAVFFILCLGVSLALAAVNTFFRDVQYIWAVVLQVGFFATTVVYTVDVFPPDLRFAFSLNPITQFLEVLRNSVIYAKLPSIFAMGGLLAVSFLALAFGAFVFKRFEPGFAEEL